MSGSGALVVFAKEPRPGFVKTRMRPALSLEQAAGLYAALLDDVLAASASQAAQFGLEPVLAVHPPAACEALARRAPPAFRAVAQRGHDPPRQHHVVRRRDGADQVAGHEEDHESQQHLLAGPPGDGGGDQDRAHGDAEGVAGDQPPGGGLVDGEVGGDLGQQPGDHELGEPDAEAAGGEGEESEWHVHSFHWCAHQ